MGGFEKKLVSVYKVRYLGNDQITTIDLPVMNCITKIIKIGRYFSIILFCFFDSTLANDIYWNRVFNCKISNYFINLSL